MRTTKFVRTAKEEFAIASVFFAVSLYTFFISKEYFVAWCSLFFSLLFVLPIILDIVSDKKKRKKRK